MVELPENHIALMDALCPEMQQASLSVSIHLKTCARCRDVLTDYGLAMIAPYLLKGQHILDELVKELLDHATKVH